MLLRSLVVVGLVGFASLSINKAIANDVVASDSRYAALEGVSFEDPDAAEGRLRLTFSDDPSGRFSRISTDVSPAPRAHRSYELALSQRAVGGLPVDVELSQRAGFGVNENGDISRESRGTELRLGAGLGDLKRRNASSFSNPIWYVFAASDDEALTWAPGTRNAFGGGASGVSLEDRVEIGDLQAGVTIEMGRVQASLAYVEREVSTQIGSNSISQDESFTGVTLTMRH
jgi:hypothetical protein